MKRLALVAAVFAAAWTLGSAASPDESADALIVDAMAASATI
jgi:hypothetical protein